MKFYADKRLSIIKYCQRKKQPPEGLSMKVKKYTFETDVGVGTFATCASKSWGFDWSHPRRSGAIRNMCRARGPLRAGLPCILGVHHFVCFSLTRPHTLFSPVLLDQCHFDCDWVHIVIFQELVVYEYRPTDDWNCFIRVIVVSLNFNTWYFIFNL